MEQRKPTHEGAGEDRDSLPVVEDREIDRFLGAGSGRVRAFHDLLAEQGVLRGLIGPREVPRLWQRHLLNSAAVAAFLPDAGSVADVGSGAGLPGIVLAAMRPDVEFHLVEPMERRCVWLREVVTALDLQNATVVRARAEDLAGELEVTAVTARAVAALDVLAPWTLPLLGAGGVLLAMKGERAHAEAEEARAVLASWGGGEPEVLVARTPAGVAETRVVRVLRETVKAPARPAKHGGSRASNRPARRRR